jgi:hypothetical protein
VVVIAKPGQVHNQVSHEPDDGYQEAELGHSGSSRCFTRYSLEG